jgi:ParB-like chromosome segregation protein Spo0J
VALRNQVFPIDKIYVPAALRKTLKPENVRAIAESMLEVGQKTPIHVRADGERFVLVKGVHRLEAAKELGEKTIVGLLVQARRH